MHYGDNRDIAWHIKKNKKYWPYIRTTVSAFQVRFPPPLKVLDVGVRDGYGTHVLKKCGYDVLGTDIVDGYIKLANKMGAVVIFDDITDSKIADSTFDVIHSRHTLHWCRSVKSALQHCHRILKPDGWVWITIPLQSEKEFLANPKKNVVMQYFPTPQHFENVLTETGFVVEYCGMSFVYGIKPYGKEMLAIARRHAD